MSFIHDDFLLETQAARRLLPRARGASADPRLPLPSAAARTSPRIGGSQISSRSGSRAITTNGARCARAALPNASAQATPSRTRNSWLGPRTVPQCLRNPLYHWTHLELKRYFGIDDLLDEKTAASVWERANEQLKTPQLSAQGILGKFCVKAVCTTDDPADPLDPPRDDRGAGLATKVYPTFRADRVHGRRISPRSSIRGSTSWRRPPNVHIAQLTDLLDALRKRHQAFHDFGGRLSDHGLDQCYAAPTARDDQAKAIFDKARAGKAATAERARGVRVLHDGVLRPSRRREGLDEAASPRRAPQREHARVARRSAATSATTRSATCRRSTRSAAISIGSSRRTRCRRRSSTTSTQPTTTRSRR